MKKLIFLLSFLILITFESLACDVCQRNQPKILKNITHGPGPQGMSDYVIIWGAILIILVVLILTCKYMFFTKNEDISTHVKHSILNDSI